MSEAKPDNTPVTDADTAVEALVRERLAAARPHDAVLGEEQGLVGDSARRRWILDPVDGTRGGSVLTTNGLLHTAALGLLAGPGSL